MYGLESLQRFVVAFAAVLLVVDQCRAYRHLIDD
jgi:hypothetical protein